MKKLNFKRITLVVIAVLFGAVVLTSCSKGGVEPYVKQLKQRETIFIFPEGTQFEKSLLLDEAIDFTLPQGYEFISMNEDETRALASTSSGSIRCDCTSGDGACKPFTAGGKTGCFTEGCSTCVGTSSNNQYITSTISFIKIPQTADGAFLSALAGFNPIHPICDIQEWIALPYMTEHFYTQVANEVDLLLERVWKKPVEEISLTENTVYVPLAVYDHKVLLAVPYDKLEPGLLYTLRKANNINSSASTCSGCSGKCKRKSVNFGVVVYCDGCDSGCTLHTER